MTSLEYLILSLGTFFEMYWRKKVLFSTIIYGYFNLAIDYQKQKNFRGLINIHININNDIFSVISQVRSGEGRVYADLTPNLKGS